MKERVLEVRWLVVYHDGEADGIKQSQCVCRTSLLSNVSPF